MRLKIFIFILFNVVSTHLCAQSQELERLRVFFGQHWIQTDSLMEEYHETVWITLTVKDSVIISAVGSFIEDSRLKNKVLSFLENKVEGFKFKESTFSTIVIPLMVGSFFNRTALTVKHEWDILKTLQTKDLDIGLKSERAVIFPIFNVRGTYSPPHKVRKNTL